MSVEDLEVRARSKEFLWMIRRTGSLVMRPRAPRSLGDWPSRATPPTPDARGSDGRVRVLIAHGAEVNLRNRFGATPILVALTNTGSEDHGIVGPLLDAGADIDIKNVAGISARDLAIDSNRQDLYTKMLRISE